MKTHRTKFSRFLPAFSLARFGIYLSLQTPASISMAYRMEHVTNSEAAAQDGLAMVLGIGGLFAVIATPLIGKLSDRTTSKYGMRRPWMVGGGIFGLLGFIIIGTANSVPLIALGWAIAQFGLNASMSMNNASITDQVPVKKRGRVSGAVGIVMPTGLLTGTLFVDEVSSDFARFVVPGIITLISLLFFAYILDDIHLTHKPAERFGFKTFLSSFYFDVKKFPDFGWVVFTKFLLVASYIAVNAYLPFYLRDEFHLAEHNSLQIILTANVAQTVMLVLASIIAGMLLDTYGKCRPLVFGSAITVALSLLVLALATDARMVVTAYGIMGLGIGIFHAASLVLATLTLPKGDEPAKNMGIYESANGLGGMLAPLAAPFVISMGAATSIGGYDIFFLFGAILALGVALAILRVKNVE
ncbi:MAG: MFS transporter [Micrococcaceae bacterium]